MLLSSAERYAMIAVSSLNASGEEKLGVRQSRLNIGIYNDYVYKIIVMCLAGTFIMSK